MKELREKRIKEFIMRRVFSKLRLIVLWKSCDKITPDLRAMMYNYLDLTELLNMRCLSKTEKETIRTKSHEGGLI